jgi:hypothetical protein
LALAVSIFAVTPALADDGAPPPAEPVVTAEQPPAEADTGSEISPPVEPEPPTDTFSAEEALPATDLPVVEDAFLATDTTVVVEAPPPTDTVAPAEELSTAEPTSTSDLLAQLPEGTELVVLDTAGESLPLATQEAAQAIVNGDPMWCPAGVAPSTLNPACGSFTFFGTTADTGLIDWLDTHDVAVPGVIWIAWNYNNTLETLANDAVVIDGNDFANLKNVSLTLQGGWYGTDGSTALHPTTPYSTFNGSLSIINWVGSVTLSDIEVATFLLADPNPNVITGGYEPALYVHTKGNIKLQRVVSHLNLGGSTEGALLDNCVDTGTACSGTGSVTITDSAFSVNTVNGLRIWSTGAVTLKNVSAGPNGTLAVGAVIDNSLDAVTSPVSITNSQFSGNGSLGLQSESNGTVTLKDVTANDNGPGGDSASLFL